MLPSIDDALPAVTDTQVPSSNQLLMSKPTSEMLRRIFSFPVMLGLVLAGTVYVLAGRSISDPDIWWHLRNAEVLVKQGTMVRQDLYSFTNAGTPWINHEWLAELPYYAAWRLMGVRGIYFVLMGAVELILMGVFFLAYRASGNVKSAFVASWLAVIMATISFGPRTLLFGWICLVVELLLLWEFKQGNDHTWLLPPLFLLWVNLHGSWLIGMVFLSVFIATALVDGTWGRIEAKRWTSRQRSKLFMVFALSLLALFCNPYTYHLVFYPFDLAFRQKLNVSHVTEWQSLDFHAVRGKIVFGLLAATIVLALVRRRTWRLDEVALLLIAFYSTVTYSRFLLLAAIVITPLLARELNFLPSYRAEIDKPLLNAVIILGILAGCIWTLPSERHLMEDTVKDYPVKALPYLQQFQPAGRVLNDYLWGGYLILNARHIPDFVDSRVDIFEYNGVFQDYLDIMGVKRPLELFDKYHIRYVLYEKDTPLAYLLLHNPGWKTNYDDGTTVLLERIGTTP